MGDGLESEMNTEEILSAAKEAEQTLYYKSFLAYYAVIEQLVRDVERKTIERCAAICDSVNNYDNPMTATDCAAAIRKLGEQ